MAESGITAIVHRRIKEGCEAQFRDAMRQFMEFTQGVPGHLGMQIMLPAAGGRDYTVVSRFTNQAARDAFIGSSEYRAWMTRLGVMTDGDPRINELAGLEGWFLHGDAPTLPPPPKAKMAISTFIGVYFVTTCLTLLLGSSLAGLPLLLRNLIMSAIVVSFLTWLVMPFITRLLHFWLFPKH